MDYYRERRGERVWTRWLMFFRGRHRVLYKLTGDIGASFRSAPRETVRAPRASGGAPPHSTSSHSRGRSLMISRHPARPTERLIKAGCRQATSPSTARRRTSGRRSPITSRGNRSRRQLCTSRGSDNLICLSSRNLICLSSRQVRAGCVYSSHGAIQVVRLGST
jgi:hypothetical protein